MAATDWGKIALLESRLVWHRRKYAFRVGKLHDWEETERTALYWQHKHEVERQVQDAARNRRDAEQARTYVIKWRVLAQPEAVEIHRLEVALRELRPKPKPLNSVVEWEHRLAREHPECREGIRKVIAAIKAEFPDLVITSTTGGHHVAGSLHYQGRAMDLASGNMDYEGRWIGQHLRQRLTEGIHNPTLAVKYGNFVDGPSFYASVWAGHTNHLHIGV